MSDQKEIIGSMLDDLAAEVVVLEPGDLMTYGDVLSRLEQLSITCDGAGEPLLAQLSVSLKSHLEAMILGEYADQDKGVEILNQGVTLGQSVFRGEAESSAVQGFLTEHDLPGAGEAAEAAAEAGGGEEAAPPAEEPAQEPAAAQPAEAEPFTPEDEELLAGFVAEALEHLESIEVNTLLLEDNPEDQEALNAVFRPFHTIKGVSGFLNLMEINHLAHQLENLLDQARSGNLLIDSVAIDVILAGVDQLRQMINESQAAAAERRPLIVFDVSELEERIEQVISGAAAEEAPEPEEEAPPAPPLGEILVEEEGVPPEAVEQALSRQKEGTMRPLGEILVHEGTAKPAQVAGALKAQKAMAQPPAAKGPAVQEVKIDTVKLDNLLDMVGELVIAGSMVRANPHVQAISDRKLMADLGQLSRITTELQKTTMSMRMVPIKQTFQKMVRVVRDTAKKRGRKVALELEGEGTEIDRNMVEKFYDPLMHMVRNSVDHGIEDAAERLAAGKPEEGTVVLAAYHKGGNVCIEIRDDGKGLDRDKIIAKALENGLVTEAEVETMGEEEAYHLIFKAGFSTAEVVTEISGRGVGMDVVQRTIDELRGKVEITTTVGQGTTFTIALPLTLAIIDGMVVEVGAERFILPTISVAESLRPNQKDYNTVQGRGEMIMIRGNLLPLVRLHNIVGVEPAERHPWDALVVVVEHHGQMRCLLVDRLIGRQEVVIKSLGQGLKGVKVVAGGAIMGDGRVGLILDVEGVFKAHEGRRG
jgi:two-component system chemotaxis sensor kinase CheA